MLCLVQKMKKINRYVLVNAIMLLIACMGIYISFFMNSVDRSLWLDEALLAESFTKRSFLGIFLEGQFANLQSAPIGWLWFEKILTISFGNTPYVLRMGSVAGFILIIILLSLIQGYYYRSRFPFAAAAFISNIPIVLRYSNMFKPYITDGAATMVVAFTYGLWKREKMSTGMLAAVWMCLIWFSQTSCFMIGGYCLCEFLFSCLDKDKKGAKRSVILGSAAVSSFLVYFVVWGRRMASLSRMQQDWQSSFFPLFPQSVSELIRGYYLLKSVALEFDRTWFLVAALFAGGLILAVWKKDRMVMGLFLGLGVALLASAAHLYPISGRLWGFCYPAIALIAFVTIEEIIPREKQIEIPAALVMIIIILSNTGKWYAQTSDVYLKDQEVKLEMDYLRDHMDPDDMVYVYSYSKAGFEYINGYGNTSFGGGKNNVVFGDLDHNKSLVIDCRLEKEKILSYPELWIVSTHVEASRWQFVELADAMHQNGYLELVDYQYESPLWYYTESLKDVKKHFVMNLQSVDIGDEYNEAVIHIRNDGEAYLNNPFDEIFLEEKESGKLYPIQDLIASGEEVDITVWFPANEEPEFILRSRYGRIAEEDTFRITKQTMENCQKVK